jgi:hypothetical protein
MSPTETIEITLAPHFTVEVETHGFQGPVCADAIRWLETALGGTVAARTRKPEYFQVSRQKAAVKQRQR